MTWTPRPRPPPILLVALAYADKVGGSWTSLLPQRCLSASGADRRVELSGGDRGAVVQKPGEMRQVRWARQQDPRDDQVAVGRLVRVPCRSAKGHLKESIVNVHVGSHGCFRRCCLHLHGWPRMGRRGQWRASGAAMVCIVSRSFPGPDAGKRGCSGLFDHCPNARF